MIEVYEILTCRYCKNVNLHLELNQHNITRGHSLKLVNSKCHYDLRKFSFWVRIVNIWNSLPASVNSANNVNTFKNRLNKFWTDQELMYDYKSKLTGIGNRSSVDNFDDTIFSFIIMLWICNKRQKWRQCVVTRYLINRVIVNTRSRELFARINSRQCETALTQDTTNTIVETLFTIFKRECSNKKNITLTRHESTQHNISHAS